MGAVVHQGLNSLLALEAGWLVLVERCVHDLLVHGLELSKLIQVDLDARQLGHQLTNDSEYVPHSRGEGSFLDVGGFGHRVEACSDRRSENDCRLSLKLCHVLGVLELVHVEELLVQLQVDYLPALAQRLISHHAEPWHLEGFAAINLLDAFSVQKYNDYKFRACFY